MEYIILSISHVRGDMQSPRYEYKHLQCYYRITNPDNPDIGIALSPLRGWCFGVTSYTGVNTPAYAVSPLQG